MISVDEMEDRLVEINRKVDVYCKMVEDEIYEFESGDEFLLEHARDTAWELADLVDRTRIDPTNIDMSEAKDIANDLNYTENRVARAGVKYTGNGNYEVREELPNEEFSLGHLYREAITNPEEVNERHNSNPFLEFLAEEAEQSSQE